MKYQKSMLKIMQGIFCSRKEKTIERTIKDSRTGRKHWKTNKSEDGFFMDFGNNKDQWKKQNIFLCY